MLKAAMKSNSCSDFSAEELEELTQLAQLALTSDTLFMKLINIAGEAADDLVKKLPDDWQEKLKAAGEQALEAAYSYAHNSQDDRTDSWSNSIAAWAQGETWHRYASALTGALGGIGGLATTIVDLPVTTTLILRSIQQIASSHGEDLTAPEVRAECLKVFALGGPLPDDDDQNASLWTLRLALTGKVVAGIIAAAAPRFGLMISQKVLTQATPLLGAIAGGTINPLYTQYYQTMAHVHFRLLKMEREHDPEQVRACFERIFRAVRGK